MTNCCLQHEKQNILIKSESSPMRTRTSNLMHRFMNSERLKPLSYSDSYRQLLLLLYISFGSMIGHPFKTSKPFFLAFKLFLLMILNYSQLSTLLISYIYNPCTYFTMHFSQFGCFFPHLKLVTEAGFLFPVYCFRS